MERTAYNDMHAKGFDSPAQESYCIQRAVEGNDQFWWVWEVLDLHGHAPGWDKHKRRPDGTFLSFPGPSKNKDSKEKKGRPDPTMSALRQRLLTLAVLFPNSHGSEAEQLIKIANALEDSQ